MYPAFSELGVYVLVWLRAPGTCITLVVWVTLLKWDLHQRGYSHQQNCACGQVMTVRDPASSCIALRTSVLTDDRSSLTSVTFAVPVDNFRATEFFSYSLISLLYSLLSWLIDIICFSFFSGRRPTKTKDKKKKKKNLMERAQKQHSIFLATDKTSQ